MSGTAAGQDAGAPPGAPSGAPPGAPPPHGLPGSPDDVSGNADGASARFKQAQKALKLLGVVQKQMDSLMKLGDIVQPEDVITAAGHIVGAGADALQLASLLASMPEASGEALAGWVVQQDQITQKNAAMVQAKAEQARQELAVASLHSVIHHTIGSGAPTAPQGPGPNALMPGPRPSAPVPSGGGAGPLGV